MDETLASVVLVLKNLCFNIVSILTVLVALGNELKRLKLTYAWLEDRRAELERAWKISLAVYLGLSVLYAGLKHEPAALVLDVLVIGLMVYAVFWLRKRGPALTADGGSTRRPRGELDDEETFEPRRPLRNRRERRGLAPEGDLQPRRRRRREADEAYDEDQPPLE